MLIRGDLQFRAVALRDPPPAKAGAKSLPSHKSWPCRYKVILFKPLARQQQWRWREYLEFCWHRRQRDDLGPIEGGVHIPTPSAFIAVACSAIGAVPVARWIGRASQSSFAMGSGAIWMFTHQAFSLPCRCRS